MAIIFLAIPIIVFLAGNLLFSDKTTFLEYRDLPLNSTIKNTITAN